MKIISWNVNGLRAILKKNFELFLEEEDADIVCLQEIKISQDKIETEDISFAKYNSFWNPAQRPGYSGTLILYKKDINVISENIGLNIEKFDIEGRVQYLELKDFFLVNTYFPNSNDQLSRLPYKLEFNKEIAKFLKKLEKKKPIILTGDLNVAHNEIDLARPKANQKSAGFTKEERDWMTSFLSLGFIDTFRYFYPDKIQYSWWSYRGAARVNNVGWRIDYFCASKSMIKKIQDSIIMDKVLGSDHAPVQILIK